MSNKTLQKYSLRCSSENKIVYTWNENQPQVCPNNITHLIDLNSIKITDSVMQNGVNIIQSSGDTGNNYRVESRRLVIPANSELIQEYTWQYPIDVMTINWYADTSNLGDIINGYMGPNTTIGAITRNISSGDTLIYVSSTVLSYIKIGYELNITNGVNNISMGEVKAIDKVNNTLLCTISASGSINAPAYVQMTIHNIYNVYLVPGITNLANKRVTSSALPKNTVARLKYTNNGNTEKTFFMYFEFMY